MTCSVLSASIAVAPPMHEAAVAAMLPARQMRDGAVAIVVLCAGSAVLLSHRARWPGIRCRADTARQQIRCSRPAGTRRAAPPRRLLRGPTAHSTRPPLVTMLAIAQFGAGVEHLARQRRGAIQPADRARPSAP
jgi:hypothetical protein